MDVGADREQLRRHRAPAAAHRHARRDRRQVRAQHAGVDQLARQQPLEIVLPARGNPAADDRDDVGGRAADVDQQRVRVLIGHRQRGRDPVGGGDVPGPRSRRLHGDELAGRRQHARVAERRLGGVEHERHALALGAERVGQLGGHRDRHRVRRPAISRSTAASPSGSRQTSKGRDTVRSDVPSSQAAFVFAPPMSTASVAGMRVVGVIDLKAGDGGPCRARRARTLSPARRPARARAQVRARRAVRRRPRRDHRRPAERDHRRAGVRGTRHGRRRGQRAAAGCWTSACTASWSGPKR